MADSCIVLPALYTRSTAKKKKGWLDGIIAVSQGFATLKDENGIEISRTKLSSHDAIQANQEDIEVFEGLTCMTLGGDKEAAVPVHRLTKKQRHPLRDVKLSVPRSMNTAHSSQARQPHVPVPQADEHESISGHAVLVRGDINTSLEHRCFLTQRSDSVVFQTFEQLLY